MMTLSDTKQVVGVNLRYDEALVSPCQECNAVCCYYLPLQVLPARTLHGNRLYPLPASLSPRRCTAIPWAGNGHILGGALSSPGPGGPPVQSPRYRPERPRTCTAYNEHDCWYRRALNGESKGFLRFDRHLMEQLLPMIAFDGDRNVTTVPAWAG